MCKLSQRFRKSAPIQHYLAVLVAYWGWVCLPLFAVLVNASAAAFISLLFKSLLCTVLIVDVTARRSLRVGFSLNSFISASSSCSLSLMSVEKRYIINRHSDRFSAVVSCGDSNMSRYISIYVTLSTILDLAFPVIVSDLHLANVCSSHQAGLAGLRVKKFLTGTSAGRLYIDFMVSLALSFTFLTVCILAIWSSLNVHILVCRSISILSEDNRIRIHILLNNLLFSLSFVCRIRLKYVCKTFFVLLPQFFECVDELCTI